MKTATWNWLWDKHDQVKDLFTFFIKPTASTTLKKNNNALEGTSNQDGNNQRAYKPAQLIGLFLGPIAFLLIQLFYSPEGLSPEGLAILASTVWIAIWWITEALPIPVTSLLPIILFPLTGGLAIGPTTSAYGNDTIFLFMGGFMLALTLERWNVHRRIALGIINLIGTNTERIVLGFMVATGFLSMWISNTAAAMMMVPMGLAITYQVAEALKNDRTVDTTPENFGFGKALMLAIAYAASLGGIATLIGTPPNALLAGAVNEMYGVELSFASWMLIGVPLAWVFIFITWFYLVKVAYPMKIKEFPGGKEVIKSEIKKLGSPSYEEKVVFIVFIITAFAWVTRTFLFQDLIPNLNDAIIAMIAALVLFVIPSKNKLGERLLEWKVAVKLPWGILLLFGGGLAIAAGFTTSGLSTWIGERLSGLQGVHILVVILAVVTLIIFLTEITSNTATASMMIPIMASLALALGVHPYGLLLASTIAASCAFMLPVATPPNAVVFGSGYLRIADMAKAGLFLNIIGIILVTAVIYLLVPLVWGINLTEFPEMFKQ